MTAQLRERQQERSEPLWVRAVTRLSRWALIASGVVILLMCLNVVLDVALRNVTGRPLPGTLDLISYIWMPAATLLPLGWAELRNEQIRVTLLTDAASERSQRWTGLVVEIVVIAVVAVMLWLSLDELVKSLSIGEHSTGARWVPVWPGRLALVVALSIFLLAAVARIYELFKRNGDAVPTDQIEDVVGYE